MAAVVDGRELAHDLGAAAVVSPPPRRVRRIVNSDDDDDDDDGAGGAAGAGAVAVEVASAAASSSVPSRYFPAEAEARQDAPVASRHFASASTSAEGDAGPSTDDDVVEVVRPSSWPSTQWKPHSRPRPSEHEGADRKDA
eukprot:1709540-Prymnesium_polylepis.1